MTAITPASKIVKLRYVDQIEIDPAISVVATHLFRANSIFDPDYTGIGHQPLGHDQWINFYDHYNVIGSKITVNFMTTGTDPTLDALVCGVLLKDSSGSITSPTTIMEQSNSGYKVVTNANANQGVTVRKGYSAKKFFDLKDVKDNRNLVGASFGANPTEDAYFHVYAAPISVGINPGKVRCTVTIEYICQFTERKTLLAS